MTGLLGVLGQWYAGAGADRLVPGGVIILAGMTVADPSWGPTVGLAGVLAAVSVRPRGPGPTAAEPDSADR